MTVADILNACDSAKNLMAMLNLFGVDAVMEDEQGRPHVYISGLKSLSRVPDRFFYTHGKPANYYNGTPIEQKPEDEIGWDINKLFKLTIDENGAIS